VLSVFFGSFGLSASAASDSENLIDSDLRNWEKWNEEYITVSNPSNTQCYRLEVSPKFEEIGSSTYNIWAGALYDLTNLSSGSSYRLNFHLLSPSEAGFPDAKVYNAFNVTNGVLVIGLASYYPNEDRFVLVEDSCIIINKYNYLDYFGTDININFTLPNIVNPCIIINYNCVMEYGTEASYKPAFDFKNFQLIDTEQEKEDGFFDKLFQFFHDLKWELIGGNCEDPSCNKNPHKSLPEKLGDLIKSLFVPDEQFIETWKEELELLLQDRLGIIWDAGDFFISFIQTVGDLLTTTADDIHYELPAMEIELNGQTYMLWQAQQVDFSFLEKNAFFAMLYKLYKAVLNVFLGIPLLNYAKKEMDATLHN